MSLFDSETIDVPCEGCGKQHAKSIGWIKAHSEIHCSCGATIKIDKSQFVRELARVEKALDDLPKSFSIKF